MAVSVTLPFVHSTMRVASSGRGLRSPYSQPFTARGDTPNCCAARAIAASVS
jgi:hypothetical protein